MPKSEVEQRIRQLVAEQRYPEVAPLLHEYAAEVVNDCVHACDEGRFQEARSFLQSTISLVKSQQAHDSQRLLSLTRQRRYISPEGLCGPEFDVTG